MAGILTIYHLCHSLNLPSQSLGSRLSVKFPQWGVSLKNGVVDNLRILVA